MRCISPGAALILTLAHPVQAAPTADPLGLRAIRDQAQALDATARTTPPPTWLCLTPDTVGAAAGDDLGRKILSRMQEAPPAVSACTDLGRLCGTAQAAAEPVACPAASPGVTYTVLVSRSLGAEALRATAQSAIPRQEYFAPLVISTAVDAVLL